MSAAGELEKVVNPRGGGMYHTGFEQLVQRIIQSVNKERLAELRRDFHTRLRITLSQPDNTELAEDLWDFFYDWCVFERQIPESLDSLTSEEKWVWQRAKAHNQRGLYIVQKATDTFLKLKDLYHSKQFMVPKAQRNEFFGIAKGDIIEGRLVGEGEADPPKQFSFVRRPAYQPSEVHGYIKAKVRQFRRAQDLVTYQSWLWLLVGMYLKHRIYQHMPIEKIYDDNSRI